MNDIASETHGNLVWKPYLSTLPSQLKREYDGSLSGCGGGGNSTVCVYIVDVLGNLYNKVL